MEKNIVNIIMHARSLAIEYPENKERLENLSENVWEKLTPIEALKLEVALIKARLEEKQEMAQIRAYISTKNLTNK